LESAGALPSRGGAWLTPRNTTLPAHVALPESDRSRSNGTSVTREIRLKILTHRIPPFKVTNMYKIIGTDTDRSATYMTYY